MLLCVDWVCEFDSGRIAQFRADEPIVALELHLDFPFPVDGLRSTQRGGLLAWEVSPRVLEAEVGGALLIGGREVDLEELPASSVVVVLGETPRFGLPPPGLFYHEGWLLSPRRFHLLGTPLGVPTVD